MARLACDPDLCSSMGCAVQRSVEGHFNWDRKGEFLAHVYEDALRTWHAENGPKVRVATGRVRVFKGQEPVKKSPLASTDELLRRSEKG